MNRTAIMAGTSAFALLIGFSAVAEEAAIGSGDVPKHAPDAVSFLVTPSHSGAVTFPQLNFPSASAWSVDVGGNPSYALIAEGKVVVTASVGSNTRLVALHKSTGAIAWGPIELSGNANAAYDGGNVFVVSGPFGQPALMQSYSMASGKLRWTTLLSGQYAFSSGPTALNGLVYTGGAGEGGTVYALDEASGAIVWTQSVANGDDSTPAVTDTGVYVAYPCQTYGFVPSTGAALLYNNTGCDGGGGATAVVANNVLYSPNGFGSYDGMTFNATTGALLGTYVASVPPAIGKTMGFFLQSGVLTGILLHDNTIKWTFSGDGTLNTSPVLVNDTVLIGSSSGKVYAVDAGTGEQVWTADTGGAIPAGAGWGAGMPLSGLSAGNEFLVVPSGHNVVAYALTKPH